MTVNRLLQSDNQSFAVVVIICLIFTVLPVSAQERLSAEELLRFFPMDNYQSVDHEESAVIRASISYEELQNNGRYRLVRSVLPFPEEALAEADSVTHARLARLFIYVQTENDHGRRKPRSTGMAAMDIDGIAYAAENVGEDISVLRFIDPKAVIKKLVDKGLVAEEGQRLSGHIVFTIKSKDWKGVERTNYIVAVESGEILCAESIETLARMQKTGAGEEAQILSNPDYSNLEESFDYLGHQMEWTTTTNMFAAIATYVENNVEDVKQSELDRAIKFAKSGNMFPERATIWDLSNLIVMREIEFYDDEAAALKANRRRASGGFRSSDPYMTAVMNLRKYDVDGNKIVAITVFDDKSIKKLRAAREEREKMMEEKQKAQKEKDDESK